MTDGHAPKRILVCGAALAVVEGLALALIFASEPRLGLRILSMIGACHVGGRLAFIGAGFEAQLPAPATALIATFHNTVVVLLVYSLWLLLCQRLERFPLLARLRQKVERSRSLRSRWNLLGIAIFIWVPFPMTGAVVGALLAHFEGYPPRQVLPVALGSMTAGVVSWTLAFEHLYTWLREIGPHVTTTVTLLLIFLPPIWNLVRRKDGARHMPQESGAEPR